MATWFLDLGTYNWFWGLLEAENGKFHLFWTVVYTELDLSDWSWIHIADSIRAHPDFDQKYKNNQDTHNWFWRFRRYLKMSRSKTGAMRWNYTSCWPAMLRSNRQCSKAWDKLLTNSGWYGSWAVPCPWRCLRRTSGAGDGDPAGPFWNDPMKLTKNAEMIIFL